MTKLAVIYYSATGHGTAMAQRVAQAEREGQKHAQPQSKGQRHQEQHGSGERMSGGQHHGKLARGLDVDIQDAIWRHNGS